MPKDLGSAPKVEDLLPKAARFWLSGYGSGHLLSSAMASGFEYRASGTGPRVETLWVRTLGFWPNAYV
eukprot:4400913-Pyramimonas_sp.AAC.1